MVPQVQRRFTAAFDAFFASERSSSVLLVVATVASLAIANSSFGPAYVDLWNLQIGGTRLVGWINDGLMAVFFLHIGLELERELYSGELSQPSQAILPVVAAIGGMAMPALLHFAFNAGTPTQDGVGIPMATDIAFALGALAMLGSRVPAALKVFVVAYAVMDDLGAMLVIAAFYTAKLSLGYLAAAIGVWLVLVILNRRFHVQALSPYLVGGLLTWWLLHHSGVHATLAGVALAFAIPYSSRDADTASPSHRLEAWLHRPVAYGILPVFALANTGLILGGDWAQSLASTNSVGIIIGLVAGKPLGVVAGTYVAVKSGLSRLPAELNWRHIIGAGMLGGIGFTMSIFIANLAFVDAPSTVADAKFAVLVASVVSGVAGYLWLNATSRMDQPR
ncbi:MAG: Na+/H+ antiporter NhaA [Gemmatimonadaceae bacterium]|nr:Na+/H+ antiporter NhaA [Gemmatimonadaceae bacterium]